MRISSGSLASKWTLRCGMLLGLFAAGCDDTGAPPAPDLTAVAAPDMTVVASPDMTVVASPDMTKPADLTTPPDQTVVGDMATNADLVSLPDLLPLPDLIHVPTTVMVTVAPGGGLSFSPNPVTISVGDTVKWTWGGSGHNVVSGAPGVADNKFCSPNDLNCAAAATSNAGATYSHTFAAAGTFPYFCAPHAGAGMVGAVVVQ